MVDETPDATYVCPMADGSSTSGVSWPRVAVTVLLAWWTVHSAFRGSWVFIDFANLAFHEAGHLFFSFLGSTMHYLGGTLAQLLVPGLLIYHFLARQRQPIGAAFCVWWVGQSLVNISVYMADARLLAIPLVVPGRYEAERLVVSESFTVLCLVFFPEMSAAGLLPLQCIPTHQFSQLEEIGDATGAFQGLIELLA